MTPAIAGFAFLLLTTPLSEAPTPIVARNCRGAEDRWGSFSGTLTRQSGQSSLQ